MIIDVECQDGTTQIARIVTETPDLYFVNFLVKGTQDLYNFADELEEIHKDSVSGYYDVDTLEETNLFLRVPLGYVLVDDSEDEDYECTDEDESEDDVSLVDEDEDEDEA
jgi:hypothetical protein